MGIYGLATILLVIDVAILFYAVTKKNTPVGELVGEKKIVEAVFSKSIKNSYIRALGFCAVIAALFWILPLDVLGKGFSLMFSIIGLIPAYLFIMVSSSKIAVTDKRVVGAGAFGKEVDLPIDSITAVGTGMMKSIVVASPSGRVSFYGIEERDLVRQTIGNMLVERQNSNKVVISPEMFNTPKNEIGLEDLKKLKDLLEVGVITQEEFEVKKKQILGL